MRDKLSMNIVNQDGNYLHEMGSNKFIIGLVAEVNGDGAAEVPEFVPTRQELLELVKYWTRIALEAQYSTFVHAKTGSPEIRRIPFAWNRIGHIGCLLGDEVVYKAVEETTQAFEKNCNPGEWEIFVHGDQGAWESYREDVQQLRYQMERDR